MATLTFAYTDPSSGSKADECLSFSVGLPDYHVLYEDILGYGTDDKVCGTISGQTVNAVIRINETDYSTTCIVTEAWKALYNYRGTLTIAAIGYSPTAWQRMRLTGIEEEKHGPVNRYLVLTFKQMAA